MEDGDRDNNPAAILKGVGKAIQKNPQLKKLGEKGIEFATKQVDKLKNALGITKEDDSTESKEDSSSKPKQIQKEESKPDSNIQNSKSSKKQKKENQSTQENTKNGDKERKHDVHQPGTPNIDGKTFTSRRGGGGYVDQDGNIYQRDRQHKRWEVYNKRGEHQREIDHNGNQTKPKKEGRRIKP